VTTIEKEKFINKEKLDIDKEESIDKKELNIDREK